MKVTVAAIGRPSRLLAGPIREYETRARRYWKLDLVEVRAERGTARTGPAGVMGAEAARLRAAFPAGARLVALTRAGEPWSSERLAGFLQDLALRGEAGATFAIGGAFGLDPELIAAADHRLSLSAMTLPHDLARLTLAEQLYRAGTIQRGEPYHKA